MDENMKAVLVEYGEAILANGWEAGESLIEAGERRFEGFRRWAYALGIYLRAKEILDDGRRLS